MPDDTISIPVLDDETIGRLAKEIGIADLDDEGDEVPVATGDQPDPVGRKAEGDEQPPKEGLELPKPTGKDLLDMLRADPEAQKEIQRGLDNWLTQAAADAASKEEQEKFQQLIAAGDFEAIGKQYVDGLSQKSIREKVEVDVYGQVYAALFSQPELLDKSLTAEEKVKLDHTQYDSDDAYIKVLTDFVAEKRAGVSVEDRVNKTLSERIETLKNMKTQETVSNSSISSLPGGQPHNRNDEKRSSSSLISEGWRDVLEGAAERVGQEVA